MLENDDIWKASKIVSKLHYLVNLLGEEQRFFDGFLIQYHPKQYTSFLLIFNDITNRTFLNDVTKLTGERSVINTTKIQCTWMGK